MKSKEQKRAEAIERARNFYRVGSKTRFVIERKYPEEDMYLDLFRKERDKEFPIMLID